MPLSESNHEGPDLFELNLTFFHWQVNSPGVQPLETMKIVKAAVLVAEVVGADLSGCLQVGDPLAGPPSRPYPCACLPPCLLPLDPDLASAPDPPPAPDGQGCSFLLWQGPLV